MKKNPKEPKLDVSMNNCVIITQIALSIPEEYLEFAIKRIQKKVKQSLKEALNESSI